MRGQPLPPEDRIARFCKRTTAPNGEIQPSAFLLREENGKREEFLSVNWIEEHERRDELAGESIKSLYARKRERIKDGDKIAILHIGGAVKHVKDQCGIELRVLHEPSTEGLKAGDRYYDPSHSGIHDFPLDQMLVAELLVEAIEKEFSALAEELASSDGN